MPRRFGTDGIRGVANADLSAELALDCGRAVAFACRDGLLGVARVERPRVVVGRDTRVSGDMLEGALVAGLCSAGADVLRGGVLPTPAVAYLARALGADAGIVVSASHNPVEDNGIKVFGPEGWKLGERAEEALESLVGRPVRLGTGRAVGRASDVADAEERYVAHLTSTVSEDLSRLTVAVDCAHGAAWRVAPRVLRELGVRVIALHDTADGDRINAGCGATHPGVVARVAGRESVIGLTLDGDADRVLAADETGQVVDGDAIIALLAGHLRATRGLAGDGIVVTVMSNQSLRTWSAAEGITIVETPVGDRNVLEAMRERRLVLGGEQSGHVIRLDHATTGDGILTALGLLEAVAASGGRLIDTVPFRPMPQVLVNVSAANPATVVADERVGDAVESTRQQLGERGRVLLRPSGTEPLVRVMVEAPTREEADACARRIARAVESRLVG